jgi:hypothetical protein
LVVTQTWKRRTEPDIHIEKGKDFEEQPCGSTKWAEHRKNVGSTEVQRLRATEEQCDQQSAHRNDVHEFCEEEQREADR